MLLGVFENFFHRGLAVQDGADAILAHGGHAEFARFVADDDGGRGGQDQRGDLAAHAEEFGNGFASLVPGVVAGGAAFPVVELVVADVLPLKPEELQVNSCGSLGN